jgi:hypothetical protein
MNLAESDTKALPASGTGKFALVGYLWTLNGLDSRVFSLQTEVRVLDTNSIVETAPGTWECI